MMHIKFKDHRLFGSRGEDNLRFSQYMGMAAIVVNVCLCSGLTSQSTIFQSCRDGVVNVTRTI